MNCASITSQFTPYFLDETVLHRPSLEGTPHFCLQGPALVGLDLLVIATINSQRHGRKVIEKRANSILAPNFYLCLCVRSIVRDQSIAHHFDDLVSRLRTIPSEAHDHKGSALIKTGFDLWLKNEW